MRKKIFITKIVASCLLATIFTTNFGSSGEIFAKTVQDAKKSNAIEKQLKKNGLSEDEELILTFDGDASSKEIKQATKKIAKSYRVIGGKFKIDKNLPKYKQERLQKYLDNKKYDTIVAVDIKDELKATEAKKIATNCNIKADYNLGSSEVVPDAYGSSEPMSDEQYALGKMNVKTAWSTMSRSGYRETYIAVIDTGCDVKHKEFKGIYLPNYCVNIRSGSNGNYQKLEDMVKPDEDGHGTHVSGIIAANSNNSYGIAGITSANGDNYCRLMAIKADFRMYDEEDKGWKSCFYTSDLIKALQYAIAHGADVVNFSLGGYDNYNSAFQTEINNAKNAGVTVVAAKGNDSKDTTIFSKIEGYDNLVKEHYPSDYNNVISVSSTNSSNTLSNFSNYGNVDIAAPGSNILSTIPGNKFEYMSGTSMATPMVTATVGLVVAVNWSGVDAEEIIKYTAKNLNNTKKYGAGLVDTGWAVQRSKYLDLKDDSEKITSISVTSAGNVKLKWTDRGAEEGYCISRATSKNGTYSRIGYTTFNDDTVFVDKKVTKGKTYYYRVRGYMYNQHGSGLVDGKSVAYGQYSPIKSIKVTY